MKFKELVLSAKRRRTCSETDADVRMFDKKNDDLDSRCERGEIKVFAASSNKRSEDNKSKKICQKLNCLKQRTTIKISFTSFGQERRQGGGRGFQWPTRPKTIFDIKFSLQF